MRISTWAPPLAALLALSGCRATRLAPPAEPVTSLFLRDPAQRARLLHGFDQTEDDMLWSRRSFAVRLDRPSPLPPAPLYVELDTGVPAELKLGEQAPDLTITVRVNGNEACRRTYLQPGRYDLACPVPRRALDDPQLDIEVESDRSFRDWLTGSERSLTPVAVRLIEYEATAEYRRLQHRRARAVQQEVIAERNNYPPARLREIRQVFSNLPVWKQSTYLGIPLDKNPADLWMIQHLIDETRPDVLVETGTGSGAAALYYAGVFANLGGGTVITVDLGPPPASVTDNSLWKRFVKFVPGDPAAPGIPDMVTALVAGRQALVVLGVGKARRDLDAELRLYSPLVAAAGYLVVERTNLDGSPTPALAAVTRFLAQDAGRQFEPDPSRDAYLIGFNRGGWLRRKGERP